jgi:hypothetical protein
MDAHFVVDYSETDFSCDGTSAAGWALRIKREPRPCSLTILEAPCFRGSVGALVGARAFALFERRLKGFQLYPAFLRPLLISTLPLCGFFVLSQYLGANSSTRDEPVAAARPIASLSSPAGRQFALSLHSDDRSGSRFVLSEWWRDNGSGGFPEAYTDEYRLQDE